jgi:tetratricopeptide (TPR) repeat protein
MLELDGRLLEAVEAYEEAGRLDPESAELQRVLARVRGRLGQPDLALEHAERAFELDPEDELNRRTLAGLYIATKRYAPAADLLQPMFDADELSTDGLLVLLNLYVELGREDEARRVGQRILGGDPSEMGPPRARSFLAVGKSYERLGAWEDAAFTYRRGLQFWPREAALYDAVAGVRRQEQDQAGELAVLEEKLLSLPGDPAALFRIAQIHESTGDRDAALRALESLVRAHPDHVNARLQLGFVYYQAGRLDDAAREFEQVAQDNPEILEVRYFLGAVYEEAGNDEAAEEVLRGVPPQSSRFAESRLLLSRILEDQGRFDEALAEARSVAAADPSETSHQIYLAGLLQRSGDLAGAAAIMTPLIEADPENPELYYDLGVLYGEAGQEDEALAWMRRSLDQDPSHPGALNYIGYTWAEKGVRLEEAEAMIRQALELKPEDGYITDSLGWVLYKRGLQRLAAGEIEGARADLAQAVLELERARELTDPDDPVIMRHLADAYRSVARLDDALQAYERALELDPEGDDEADIRRQIELLKMELQGVTSGAPR